VSSEEVREGACPEGPITPAVKLTPTPAQTMLGGQEKAVYRIWPNGSVVKGLLNQGLERPRKKVVGKPYEGEPHVRFEVAGNGDQDTVKLLRHSQRKRGATDRPYLTLRRHSLTLPLRRMRALACGNHSSLYAQSGSQIGSPLVAMEYIVVQTICLQIMPNKIYLLHVRQTNLLGLVIKR